MTIAFRGSSEIEADVELRAHLANLLRLENVGVLLGAGASVSAGGRTVRDLWADFVGSSKQQIEWMAEQGFLRDADVEAGFPEVPNIEVLADILGIALAEWERSGDDRLAPGKAALDEMRRAVIRASLLDEKWWTSIDAVDPEEDGLKYHRAILQKLTAARQPGQSSPWIFTTNYDLAIEWAAEAIDMSVVNGFVGTHGRHFSPQSFDLGYRNTQTRGEARFGAYNIYLAKLHGSLTWSQRRETYYEHQAASAWPLIEAFLNKPGTTFNGLVLPSAAKYVQTVGFALGELLRRFAEFLARPQVCLVLCGYGFGDEHINRLVSSALLNPTLQIVVYFPEFTGMNNLGVLPPALRRLVALNSPRLTLVGGGAGAHLAALAAHLPEPAVYDEDLRDLELRLQRSGEEPANGKIEL